MAKTSRKAAQPMATRPQSQSIKSNKLVRPDMRKPLGQKFHQEHLPGAADQFGQAIDPKAYRPIDARRFVRPGMPEQGNAVALNVGKGGPGTGRTVYPCGYQALHGTPVRGEKNTSPDPKATSGPRGKALG